MQADLTEIESSIETFAATNLNADALATWNSSGTTIIDELITLIQTEYETVKANILTNVDTAITAGETEAVAAAGTAQQTTTDQGVELQTTINNVSIFEKDKLSKDLTKPIEQASKKIDKDADGMEKAVESSTKDADKEATKNQKKDDKAANKTISTQIKNDSRTI